jgi:hypothetical protein
VALVAGTPAWATDWKPIAPAELALKVPRVQSGADAEALLWEVRIADDLDEDIGRFTTTYRHYLRIKIFTDRGRDAHGTIDIRYTSRMRVRDIAARTIRPDGSSVEVKKSDVYERTLIKADDLKLKTYSFAMPAVEPGAIIEYQWREVHRDSIAMNLRLPFSRDIPVHIVRYYLQPLDIPGGFGMATLPFNGKFTPLERQKDGFWMLGLSDVAAKRPEPYGLPALEREPWVFVYYTSKFLLTGRLMWLGFAKGLHDAYALRTQPNDEIRQLALAATAKMQLPGDRIQGLVQLARSRIRRVDLDTSDPAERRNIKDDAKARDILKRGVGTADDVLVVFLALAQAAGFDARVAAGPNHALVFHNPETHPHTSFLSARLAAVRTTADWTIVDPANEHSGTGELRWYNEGEDLLLADPKDIVQARSPVTPATTSVKRRTGTFTLTEDGTLEGDCRLEYRGHWGQMMRDEQGQDASAEREQALRALIAERIPGAEVTDIRIEHVTDPSRPLTANYRLRIPGYAQRTGSRWFLRPSVFHHGIEATFPSATRFGDVYFEFGWTEEDEVSIALPPGFELEQPANPESVSARGAKYSASISTRDNWRTLVLKRSFAFGEGPAIRIAAANYAALKKFFDYVHEGDAHTLVLRRESSR